MVHRDEEDVIAIVEPQEADAQQRAAVEHKRPACLERRETHGLGLPSIGGQMLEVVERDVDARFGRDALLRLAIDGLQRRPERLVPLDKDVEAVLEHDRVHMRVEPDRDGDVVPAVARHQAVEKPQPLLSERAWSAIAIAPPRNRAPPAHRDRRRLENTLRQAPDRRRLEHGAKRQIDLEHIPDARDERDRQQGVAAMIGEEVVVDADMVGVHNLLPDRCQPFLHVGRRMLVFRRRAWPFRRRERLNVDLAVPGDRQRVERDERRRHQWIGQLGGQELT